MKFGKHSKKSKIKLEVQAYFHQKYCVSLTHNVESQKSGHHKLEYGHIEGLTPKF